MRIHTHLIWLSLLLSNSCPAQSIAEQQDARVIENLIAAGSDISKPHEIDFFMFLPGESKAEAAASEMEQLGYTVVSMAPLSGQNTWEIHAVREMTPRLDIMTATTRALEAIAAKHGGDYDGWGTGVVK